ncbi:MAG TPA: amidohydrolase family protein, partial [Steroidobacter sp.]|nr:amidohydrolase family protein [Steroidobacter sp.]
LPGLIDAHTHLTEDAAMPPQRSSTAATDFALMGTRAAVRTLQAGFTTVRNLGAPEFSDIALTRAIEKGWVDGPDMISSGHSIGISGGHCDGVPASDRTNANPLYGLADGPAEVTKAVRLQVKNGAKVIKICVTAGVTSIGNSLDAVQMTDEEIAAAVAEAHRQGVRVAAHAHGAAGILAAARGGVDSIEHASYMTPEALRLIQAKKITLVPTLYLFSTFDLNRLPERLRSPAVALKNHAEASFRSEVAAHANIVFGSDAAVIPHGDNAHEFATRVALGQSPKDAILSATSRAADLLGLNDRGVITVGRRADLIAVEGDPLADIRTLEHVRFVMKLGRVYKGDQGRDAASDVVIKRGK